MYHETYGTGEPLLIIHGNGGSISDFTAEIPYFSQHYKVILADSRGQGKTTYTGDSLSYEMMADELAVLLDRYIKNEGFGTFKQAEYISPRLFHCNQYRILGGYNNLWNQIKN